MGVYEKLADAMNVLPNGFPRTETGSDVRLLKFMYSEKEAELASQLTMHPESPADIAERIGRLRKEVTAGLFSMVREGKVWMRKVDGKKCFRLAPFLVGSYEDHGKYMNEEMALLVEEYMADGGAKGIMGFNPAVHRVVPTPDASDLEWILPYDNVMEILNNAKTFHANECICRKETAALGRDCDAPKNNCMSFSTAERAPVPGDISREEAIEMIKEADKAGLVHSVSNVVDGIHYICNCCGCCCGILRGINDWGRFCICNHSNGNSSAYILCKRSSKRFVTEYSNCILGIYPDHINAYYGCPRSDTWSNSR